MTRNVSKSNRLSLFDELNGVPASQARRYELNLEVEPSTQGANSALNATGISDKATPQDFLSEVAADPSGLTTTAQNQESEEQGAPQVGLPPLFAKNDPFAGPVADGTPSLVHRLLQGDKLRPEPRLCGCPSCSTLRVSGTAVGTASTAVAAAGTVAALSLLDTFKLHSNPLATKSIYLDFDGYLIAAGSAWSNIYNGGTTINAPAWSIDADPTSFNDAERAVIQGIWQRVAEDFAPFNINVTTEYLGEGYLTRSDSSDQVFGTRALISPISSYFGYFGGIAFVDVFAYVGDDFKPALIFPENLGPNDEKDIAEAISHEVGHNLGLSHDGDAIWDYYPGQGSGETGWAPIMGSSYDQPLSQWSQGEYAGANQKEDDLAIISGNTNGFGYRTDAAGNNALSAATLTVAGANATTSFLVDVFQFGIIETRTDLDWYAFSTGVGTISLSVRAITQAFINTGSSFLNSYVTATAGSSNLDIWAGLYAADGTTLLSWSNPLEGLGASFSYNITTAGTYYLAIDGVGKDGPLTTGYTDYGSLGQYLISGTLVTTRPIMPLLSFSTSPQTVVEGQSASVTYTVRLSEASPLAVSVAYATANGTAAAGSDYTASSGTLEFAAGETSKTITINLLNDSLNEPNETFTLSLSAPTNAALGSASSVTTTLKDAPVVPTLTLAADTGLDPTDGITANGTVLIEGLQTSATWQYSTDGGSSWINGTGTSFRLTGTGPRSVIARQQDQAGDLSPASAPLSFSLTGDAGLRLSAGFAQLIYVAYYGRPADPGGLAFWNDVLHTNAVSYAPRLGDGLTGSEFDSYNRIVNDFGNSTEAINLLAGLTNQQKVYQVYQFCFNRDAETDPITGVNYWVGQLDQGNVSLAQLAIEVALGAQANDIVVLSNKIRSADSFTDAIDTPAESSAFTGEAARLYGIDYLRPFGEDAAGPSLGADALGQFVGSV